MIAVAVAVAATGCATPAYYVRPADLGATEAPAIRASDGAEVRLARGTFRGTGEPARGDGRVVVRGLGVHGWRFKSGLIVLGFGAAMALGGAVLAVSGLDFCGLAENCDGTQHVNPAFFPVGLAIAIIGDGASLVAGPALLISGGRESAVERP